MQTILSTPWGIAQDITPIGSNGIISVSTAGHGGIFVPEHVYATMPSELKCNCYGGGTWFEEDIEVALVVLAFPDLFEPRVVLCAVQTIDAYSEGGTYDRAARWLARNRDRFAAMIETAKRQAVLA